MVIGGINANINQLSLLLYLVWFYYSFSFSGYDEGEYPMYSWWKYKLAQPVEKFNTEGSKIKKKSTP